MFVKITSFYIALFLVLAVSLDLSGQGLRGRVLDQDGNPLSFTTIYVAETGSGNVSNVNGSYEIKLSPGQYTLNFQHLGYASVQEKVEITDAWKEKDIVLQKQAYLLGEAEVEGGAEDPAYKIMRKVIAKSAFHRQQVENYTCTVYLKGGGRLIDYPWFMRKAMEEEGIDTAATFVQESVTEISYERPNKYTENVVSIRTVGDDRNSSPMNYINGSFYEERVAGILSPLSRKAFAYYKFKYINSFEDRGYQVNKIKVTPRVADEEFVTGYLYIVEDLWSLHTIDFVIHPQGITIDINQNYAPVLPGVWLPISHKFDGHGKLFGFEFEFQYLATVSDYEVELNPDLTSDFAVLDIKTEKEEIEKSQNKQPPVPNDTEKKLLKGEEVSTKELRKLMRDYAREERKKEDEPNVVSERTIKIDSLAYEKDSLYWVERRPVPLTESEKRGYVVQDSMAVEAEKKASGDTLASKSSKFSPSHLLLGNTYRIGKTDFLRIHNPLISLRFNTVDGWNGEYALSYFRNFKRETGGRFEFTPRFRYAAARDKGFGTLSSQYIYGLTHRRGKIGVTGGSYFSQFNAEEPISTFTNTISSLFSQNNFMKIYDEKFVEANWEQFVHTKWKVESGVSYSRRIETDNNTNQVWINVEDRDYTSNDPRSIELPNTSFGQSDAFKIRLKTEWHPAAIAYKRNKRYYRVQKYPIIGLEFERAFSGVGEADIEFSRFSAYFQHTLPLGIFGDLNIKSEAGIFADRDKMDFMDYAHFLGNQTIFTRFDQLRGYSIMPYYLYSTNDRYASTYLNLEMRRFVFSQIAKLRLLGVSENINVNHLYTPTAKNYVEVSYSVTNIFRLFRIDVTGAFLDGSYEDFRVQIGITSDLFQVD